MRRSVQFRRAQLVQLVSFLLMLVVSPVGNLPLTAQTVSSSSRVHRTAPNFSLVDLNHKKIELTSYRGKVVLLAFWATWCAPCLTEMPTFAEWQQQYGSEKFQVIGVSMDDAAPEVIATVSKLKLDYPVLMGNERLGAAYGGILGLPVTFVIDRDGKIRTRYQSADLAHIKDDIQSLLKSK